MIRYLPSLFSAFIIFFCSAVYGQTPLPENTIITQNFNSIGGSGTATLPANWKISAAGAGASSGYATGSNLLVTTQAANGGTPATGGAYNWASTAGTDRAIGFMASASYAGPNSIMAHYRNTTGATVNSVTIAFVIKRYVVNTSTASVAFSSSNDGSAWVPQTAGDITTADFIPGANAGTFASPKSIYKIVTANVTVPNNGDIYFRWVFTNTGNINSQGLGLDDVSVFAGTATPVVTATLRDSLLVDNGVPNQFNEGDVIRYETVIKNIGTGDASNVEITLPAPPTNTTMVPGSIKTSAVAVDDNYNASFNTILNGSSVLANDFGLPLPTAVFTFGPTNNPALHIAGVAGTTNAGGAITLNANGTFTYTPPTGFSGIDQFKYITGNGNLPNNDAIVNITVSADISFTTTNVDPACNGGSNGSISFNAAGGNGPLTYSITGAGGTFQSSNIFTGLTAGVYNLAVKDAGGLIKTGTVTLNDPASIVVSGSISNLIYNTALSATTFTKTGGTGAITWSATGFPSGVNINSSTGAVSGTPSETGTFNAVITATDANSCTATKSISFTVAPQLGDDTYNAVVGNTQLVADGHSVPTTPFTVSATNILANDVSDAAISITAVTNAATTAGGTITINSNGKFTYSPPNGSTTADSYTYTATSNGVTATATINFTIANMVWFVNNTYAGANGTANGSSHRPYTDVASAATASSANHTIYIHTGSGNTTGNAVLKPGQTLRGEGSALSVGALSLTAGTKPTLTGMVTLATNVKADGFDMLTGATTAFTNAGATVTGVTVNVGSVTTTTGTGITLTGTGNNVNITLSSLTTNGAANAVNLVNTAGTVTVNGGSQTGSTGATFNVNGGTVALTYNGSVTQAANAPMVSVSGGHATGAITFQTGTLSATNGTGLQFDNADGTYNFNGTTTLNGGDAGIDILNGSSGNFNFASSTSITNPTNEAIKINASTANVTYSGTFTKTNNSVSGIFINGETGGTITINGTGTKTLTTSAANAINLVNNTGATINFSGDNLLLTTTSGNGFNATGGGTVSVAGTGNIINATSGGTALNVVNTTIGASGLNFKSISTNSAVNGIVVNNTGSGGLTVTGDAGSVNNSSGGTIQGSTNNGISLTNCQNISLDQMNIQSTTHSGINGTQVTNFSLTNSTINNSGNQLSESNISFNGNSTSFGNNISGTLTITGCTLTNAYYSGLDVQSDNGTVSNAIISNNTITSSNSSATSKGMGINLVGIGNASTCFNLTKATISGNTITNFPGGAGIQVSIGNSNAGGPGATAGIPGSATDIISITGNFIKGESAANPIGTHCIIVANSGGNNGSRTRTNFEILNNGSAAVPLGNNIGTTIAIGNNGNATMVGTINNNYIVSNNSLGSNGIGGGNGYVLSNSDSPDLTLSINGNTISKVDGNGILLVGRGSSGNAKLTIKNNTVAAPLGSFRPGIRIDAGNASSINDAVCLDIQGNTSAGSDGQPGIGLRKQGTNPATNVFGIKGMAATASPGIEAFIDSQNPAGGGTLLLSASSGFSNCSSAPANIIQTDNSSQKK